MHRFHGETATLTLKNDGLWQTLSEVRQIKRGGHQHHGQIRLKQRSRFTEQRQGKIGVASTFVKFIEQHALDAFKRRISLQATEKETIGQHFDAGLRRATSFPADGKADLIAHRLTQAVCQAFRSCPNGQSPRLHHPDVSLDRLGLSHGTDRSQQSQWDAGGFSCAGGGL